jgi:hypothetical protein
MAKGKFKSMHIKSMAGGHTVRVEKEPDGDEGGMMGGQSEESMHPDGSIGAAHVHGLLKAHADAQKGKGSPKKSMSMPAEAMSKAFGR